MGATSDETRRGGLLGRAAKESLVSVVERSSGVPEEKDLRGARIISISVSFKLDTLSPRRGGRDIFSDNYALGDTFRLFILLANENCYQFRAEFCGGNLCFAFHGE